jgi:predicted nucleic acid-binding protein
VTLVVLDASVIVKWILADRSEESDSLQALDILQLIKEARLTVVQPPHWLAEVASVITRLAPERARQTIALLHALEFPVVAEPDVYQRACEIALSLKLHLFDALYHAVALTEPGAVFVTADERYFRKAQGLGRIMRLKDYRMAI